MNIRKAWSTLGVDPDEIFEKLSSVQVEHRAKMAGEMLEDAKTRARGLMSVLHPDKPGGDHKSFVLIQKAISTITSDTEAFVRRISGVQSGDGQVTIRV